MKTAKEIYVDNRVRTVMECSVCGATTHVKAGIDTKTARAVLERPCGACHACGPLFVIAWKKRGGWDGWLGPGMMNTQRSVGE